MRNSIAKHIEELIPNEKVIERHENPDDITNFKRRKKKFWHKLNWKEKTKLNKKK